jgi:hypothetical protein
LTKAQPGLNERRTSRDMRPSNLLNKHNKIANVPFSEVNFSLDAVVMEKISDLITSINQNNINYNSKDTEPPKVK